MLKLPATVVGVDVYGKGWVAVALRPAAPPQATAHAAFADVIDRYGGAAVIGVDIPIGLPKSGVRAADRKARLFLRGGRTSSVYDAPPRPVIEAATYAEARRVAQRVWQRGVSAQSYRLGVKILEVDEVAQGDGRVIEVHPEVSFAAMADGPLTSSKKSWDGQMLRRRLLRTAGITLPDRLPDAGTVPPDDILDAAAVAWSAARRARGEGRSLPDPPEVGPGGRLMAIWY